MAKAPRSFLNRRWCSTGEQIPTLGLMDDSMPEQMDIPECTAACKKPVLEQRMRIKEADKKKCCVLTIPSPKQTDAVPRVASLKGLRATCRGNQEVGRKGVGS